MAREIALNRAAIKAIIGDMADRPAAANNLLDRLKVLMTLALDLGWRSDHRCAGQRQRRPGHHPGRLGQSSKAHPLVETMRVQGHRHPPPQPLRWCHGPRKLRQFDLRQHRCRC